jgi:hypothetical protein
MPSSHSIDSQRDTFLVIRYTTLINDQPQTNPIPLVRTRDLKNPECLFLRENHLSVSR